jgi:hypothetical protein
VSERAVFVFVYVRGGKGRGEGGVLLIFVFKRGTLFLLLSDLCSVVELVMFFFFPFFSLLFSAA